MPQNAKTIWADGPGVDPHEPDKEQIRAWGTWIEGLITAFTSNGGLIYASRALLLDDLDHAPNTMAWVMGDATVANNGVYMKFGVAGEGTWTRVADLPYSFVRLDDVGAGTPNAIQLASDIPTTSSIMRIANVFEANAGNVTISENGGVAKALLTNSGNQIASGGLTAGAMIVYVDDGTSFRLLSDQASVAIVAAAEAAQVAAELARDEAIDAAEAAALRDPAAFALAGNGTTGPYNVGETIASDSAIVVFVSGVAQIVTTDFTYSGSNITFTSITPTAADVVHGFVFAYRAVGVPSAGSVGGGSLNDGLKANIPSLSPNADVVDESRQQLLLNYHAPRTGWPIKAFGNGKTDVGGGSAATDTAALQSAVNNEQIVSMTGAVIQINDVIDVDYSSACLVAMSSGRVGDTASSRIKIVEDDMPYLFDASATNFEVSGFSISGSETNVTTIALHYKRPDGSPRDIDAVIRGMVFEKVGKVFHIYGRGLEIDNTTFAESKICIGDYDWDPTSVPNGFSNDTDETGMRGYRVSNVRAHGNVLGLRNIGPNKKNLRGLMVNAFQADIGIGGGCFIGPAKDSKFAVIESQLNATIGSGLIELHGGSKNVKISTFHGGGIKTTLVERLGRYGVVLKPEVETPENLDGSIEDIVLSCGSFGPMHRNAVYVLGSGIVSNLTLSAVTFDRTSIDGGAHSPIYIEESGGTLSLVSIKLDTCNFKHGAEAAPAYIVGGLNSANVAIYKNGLTLKQAGSEWKQSNVQLFEV